jgi:DNA-binding MarR family transcriptional regulator
MRELAEHFSCDASYITSLVDGLEEKGLAERRPCPTDRRVKTVVLTPHGASAQQQLFEMMWEPPRSFQVLSAAEQRQLRDLLRKVADADQTLQAAKQGAGLHAAATAAPAPAAPAAS